MRGFDGQKWQQLDREEPPSARRHPPPQSQHTRYQVFTNGQMYSPSALSAASHKLLRSRVSVLIDVLTKKKPSRRWHINYLRYAFPPSQHHALGDGSAHCMGLLIMKIWVRTGEKKKKSRGGGAKGKPTTRWKSTPPPDSADFQTNIMITIFWAFGVCCFRLWQSRQKKAWEKKEKKCSNMVLRVYSDHTICFLKSTFKTLLWAVPTALSLKLRLTLRSPLYYFPSV